MWKQAYQAQLIGASAALAIGLALPLDAHARGFYDFSSVGLPMMVIQIDDPAGADTESDGSGDADAGSDGSSSGDAGDSDGSAPSAQESEAESATGIESDSDGVASSDDADANPDADGATTSTDAAVSPDTSISGSGGISGEADAGPSQTDTGTSASDVSTHATESSSPSSEAATGLSGSLAGASPQGTTRGAEPADASGVSAVIREAPSSSVRTLLGPGDGVPAANAQSDMQPAPACGVVDPDCVSPDTSVASPPSRMQDPAPAASTAGVWPPPAAPGATRTGTRDERALGISLVDPIKARDGLLVQGIIVNSSGRSQSVPPMQISMKDKTGQTLQRWTMRPPVSQLPPGDHKAFKAVLQPLPRGVSRVHVAFLAGSR